MSVPWYRITKQQLEALKRLYHRSNDGAADFADFCGRVIWHRDYIGVSWCRMFVGIERDGYTHT